MQNEQGIQGGGNAGVSPNPGVSYSQASTPQIPYMIYGFPPPGTIMRGARLEGRMSAIRRFFCLFVTFDLLLTSLLWLFSLVIEGNLNFKIIFQQQIVHYNIKTSLFDTVMASASRFVVLNLFYGFLQINHWIIVALTTAGTGALVVAKVLMFDWGDTNSQVLKIMIVLTSFVISWAEAWLLDIKVVPQEKFAREYLSAPPSVYDERTPLMQNFLQSQPAPDLVSESMGSFYSPLESTDESSDEAGKSSISRRSRRSNRPAATEGYISKGKETWLACSETLRNSDWTIEKETELGDTIFSVRGLDGRKIFKSTSVFEVNAEELFRILYNELEDLPKWNPNIKNAKILEVVNDSTDITCQVSKEVGKGLIACREYVTLRHHQTVGEWKIIASVSILWPRMPSSKSIIRGDVGPSCWVIKPLGNKLCEVEWLLNTKINGWIPLKAVESTLSSVMVETIAHLRNHCASVSAESSANQVSQS
ncbi:Cholesterol-capturing domain [Nesidiocoris tenuis]|uniref:Cholesterol-capturing domain n=1 Tax=Nesidiocoris tenuis TaxID=355587 RepID=A0ABN7B1M6_9HEMI|nr:Cholesterol-capturing domain [Nesidiocoris tenuis]